ncbi:MAG: hypothetical protein HZC41_08365 [Chloroflexi bacterium]|nr:hypothetical protein [Chloroflexota bacterium]
MSEEMPIWRQAIHDSQHPLHRAAWLLFSEHFNVDYAAQVLESQKDTVLDFIYLILDTDDLYQVESLGSGFAPINAVHLLGKWQVVEAIPRLLQIVAQEDWEAVVTGQACRALEDMGAAAIEPLLEFAAASPNQRVTVASILGAAGKGDARAYAFIKAVFEEQTNDMDIEYVAEHLLTCDSQQAIPYLEDGLRQGKIKKSVRRRLESYIQQARDGQFDQ